MTQELPLGGAFPWHLSSLCPHPTPPPAHALRPKRRATATAEAVPPCEAGRPIPRWPGETRGQSPGRSRGSLEFFVG